MMNSDIFISILLGVCLAFIALITAIGNLIVLFAFYYEKKLRTINDYFIMNMAIADFLVGSFCIPFYIPFSIKQSWPFGRLFCKIWVTVDDVATMASVINIVAISVNRYWLIAYPISYRKYIRQHLVYIAMGFIWFISFINFAPGIWLISLFSKTQENRSDCSGDYNHSFVYMLIAQFNYFIWPFIVLCILNLLIMLNIWKRTRKMSGLRSIQVLKNNSISQDKKSLSNIKKKKYQSKRNPPKIFTEKVTSPPPSPSTNTIKTSFIEQYSPIIQPRRLTNKQFNYLDKPTKSTNGNSSNDCRSFPSVKSVNLNPPTFENNPNDIIVDLNTQTDSQTIKKLNEEIKENRRLVQRDLRINRDRKAARSLFILVIVFLIFLFPYVICAIASTASFKISPTIFEISFWLLWLNSTCNPFLYPFIQTKYRRAYIKLFQSCFKRSI